MANTRRTVLYLDPDAFDLLGQLAPSEKRRGKYVSELIHLAAAQREAPATAEQEQKRAAGLAALHDQMLRLVGELAAVTARIRNLEREG